MFDAIDAHPGVGTQLSREPWQAAILQILERIGGQLQLDPAVRASDRGAAARP